MRVAVGWVTSGDGFPEEGEGCPVGCPDGEDVTCGLGDGEAELSGLGEDVARRVGDAVPLGRGWAAGLVRPRGGVDEGADGEGDGDREYPKAGRPFASPGQPSDGSFVPARTPLTSVRTSAMTTTAKAMAAMVKNLARRPLWSTKTAVFSGLAFFTSRNGSGPHVTIEKLVSLCAPTVEVPRRFGSPAAPETRVQRSNGSPAGSGGRGRNRSGLGAARRQRPGYPPLPRPGQSSHGSAAGVRTPVERCRHLA
ncbi:hypothetical protein GCM10009530_60900 [Microbispora corallina]|uniref:Uncharacterized protein n=1 Tax=Microbispora corallina TaxID=83302 RepID=A0ABQ4FZ27_9ACTN|nr:hypothetical protein Mco01_30760 [Microbispora corallina]